MNAAAKITNETKIDADPKVPAIRITREFDATPDRVFNAWVDPKLVVQWLGPNDSTMQIETWDARTGGSWRYADVSDKDAPQWFYGSFHELRPNERVVQTFTWEGVPDGVALETITFEALEGGRTRVSSLSLVDSFEGRDMILSSGMDVGVLEGYQRLDALLAS
jgi:uncharacterized protein YndB with AHSA1/START domain